MTGHADNKNAKRGRLPYYQTAVTAVVEVPGRNEEATFYSRRTLRPARVRRIGDEDAVELFLLAFYFCVAALVPSGRWDGICRFMAGIRRKRHRRKRFADFERSVAATLGPEVDAGNIFEEFRTARHRRRLTLMAHVSGWHWKPRIVVKGGEEIERALSRGQGTIVWCDHLAAQTLMGKRALFEAGIAAFQVAVDNHGLSRTLVGRKLINPIMLGIEDRFLKGRLSFSDDETLGLTRRIAGVLADNGVVLIVSNCNSGRSFVELPAGLNGYAHFATTPANFLAQGKTTLLGMSTVETIPFAEYVVTIRPGPASSSDTRSLSGKALHQIAVIVAEFRDQVLKSVRSHPGQYAGFGRELVGSGTRQTAK